MTPKLMQKYQKKGIFTVKQLSYVYKPRRRRKPTAKAAATFNVELQALALRTGKIYLDDPPSIPDYPVELFLDIEGIPDEKFEYLIGLVVREGDRMIEHSFWADTCSSEQAIFRQCLDILAKYVEGPIFHYGSYEPRAFARASKKYRLNSDAIVRRLVNVNSFVFAKVYFPARSNSLKDLGAFIGATWDSPHASGLQSLVWRYRWEETREDGYKQKLLDYNRADCHAVRLLTGELREIGKAAAARSDVEFADAPKQICTHRGAEIHCAFEGILSSAHAEYRRRSIRIRGCGGLAKTGQSKVGAPKGHPGYVRIVPSKAGKLVRVRRRIKCSNQSHKGHPLEPTDELAEHTVIDLAFTKNGCRKTITKYVGTKARCSRCSRDYIPPAISRLGRQLFGHCFRAWAVYQRVALRLPYSAITRVIENLFSEQVSAASIVNFMRHMSEDYAATEGKLLERILESPFVHVDETKLNIRGTQNHVWVLTDGSHVVFRLTETREAALIQELLAGYQGVLVSDFYTGYDSVECRQQKCLVHLVRDLNDDLWKNPFNDDYESFVAAVSDLLVPIFEDAAKYGLKARHLRKHRRAVDRFYKHTIDGSTCQCDIIAKYQKRFTRYSDSLFTFLQEDGIPWNNNSAERAIRHLAVQRKISGFLFHSGAGHYLRLLGIGQTCRFQEKSFLRFLISGEKDVDAYRERKRPRSSRRVAKSHGEGP